MDLDKLIEKYSGPGPRYTSYPTAPQWTEPFEVKSYASQLSGGLVKKVEPLAIYVHLPFCEALCYYCGCNIQVISEMSRSLPYVEKIIEEMSKVSGLLGGEQRVNLVSWGGGTPTFLSLAEIEKLHKATAKLFSLERDAELSIEIDPRVTSIEQLELLREMGFNRVSLGVQDFNEQVQKAVNRVQSIKQTEEMLHYCRRLGFKGVNFDLIYGLPLQSLESFKNTVSEVVRIRPDRIALYNYAHLPSLRKHQTILDRYSKPEPRERLAIYRAAYEALTKAGYIAIGMDHFALPADELSLALQGGYLKRNFQGYTVKRGNNLLGFGASAIGEVEGAYFQNKREPKEYEESVSQEGLATFRGCFLTDEDRSRKWLIESILCRFKIDFGQYSILFGKDFRGDFSNQWPSLETFQQEGIVSITGDSMGLTSLGRLFARNVAMTFDGYLDRGNATYSQTV